MIPRGGDIMFVLFEKSRLVAVLLLILATIAALFFAAHYPISAEEPGDHVRPVIILDAGHGGEDGGASSADGLLESEINLQIVKTMQQLFQFVGQEPVLTREGEAAIYSADASTLREKKVSDLKNRVERVNTYEGCGILLSIHQNSLPSHPDVRGAQVFFNSVVPAESIAGTLQATLNQTINTGRGKSARQMGTEVFLMKESKVPGVLVECGFLSNPSESLQLASPEHQLKLSASIVAGYLKFITNEDIV